MLKNLNVLLVYDPIPVINVYDHSLSVLITGMACVHAHS